MDNRYHHALSDNYPPVYNEGYLETAYTANSAEHAVPRWTPSQGYGGYPFGPTCGFQAPFTGGEGFGCPSLAIPYGFNPSVPPPPVGHPPHEQFLGTVHIAPENTRSSGPSALHSFSQQFGTGPQTCPYDTGPNQKQQRHGYKDVLESRAVAGGPRGEDSARPGTTIAEDERALQKGQDRRWLTRFFQSRDKSPTSPQRQQRPRCVPELRETLYKSGQLLAQLRETCETLRNNVDNQCVWTDCYLQASKMTGELQDRLETLREAKVSSVAKRRARQQRARRLHQMEEKRREERISGKDAAIETWRMQWIHQVEAKKKEQELKLAADTVLCEVRKKQADVKRMQDILRSLDKLHRLRKEAASRKGIVTGPGCEEAFSSRLQQLRCVTQKRTTVYSAEEKALMVMLEGEQEEERKRERERRLKKERDTQLHRKHRVDAMLFGEELPVDHCLQPFREYYSQAELSLHVLLQIRRDWDAFAVARDHPGSSPVPKSWILPDVPSDPAWASALHTADSEGHHILLTVSTSS